ncbi:hypothetical protein M433DRAFT_148794 [Acidomyces richmondensis BFW]|nr:MAG: hypothetical protein FE78DRAFT_94908 [Acidomyces sp. 'richmondensis']KYG50519.1 hypothetical protein M433DRAFT_148794 [Acidomyces richmondensis BFW]
MKYKQNKSHDLSTSHTRARKQRSPKELPHNATTPAGEMTATTPTYDPPTPSDLLRLPAELRNKIYDFTLPDSIEVFAETGHLPSLLRTSRQIHREYSSIFYSTDRIKFDAYYHETDSWCEIAGWEAKQAILECKNTVLVSLLEFWSLASARRYCQRSGLNRESLQRGIVTVATSTGFRRWQWNVHV